MHWLKIEVMRRPQQVPGDLHASFDERLINDQLRCRIRNHRIVPSLHILDHGSKVALHIIHANTERILQVEARMLPHDGV